MALNAKFSKPLTADDAMYVNEAQLHVGMLYTKVLAMHINDLRLAERHARNEGDINGWLTEIYVLYNITEFALRKYRKDETEADTYEYLFDEKENKYIRQDVKIKRKDLFLHWFDQIEKMIWAFNKLTKNAKLDNLSKKIITARTILLKEIAEIQRSILYLVNSIGMIMPVSKMDMKRSAMSTWVDREAKKDLKF